MIADRKTMQLKACAQSGGYELDSLGAPFKVVLKNGVKIWKDPESGEDRVEIRDLIGLVLAVVRQRAVDPRKLNGAEIKFLRHALNVPANKLAKFLDVTAEHYSRCEAGTKTLSPTTEKQLRLFAFGATLYRSAEKLLDMALEQSAPPEPLNERAQMKSEKFINIFLKMKIEPVRRADDEISYVFCRRQVVSHNPKGTDDDDDWLAQDEQVAA